MPQEDGFLTLLSIQKGYKYRRLKWLWIAVAAACGGVLGLITWFYTPELIVQACIFGSLIGAGLFYLYLKNLPEKLKEKE